MPSPVYSKPNKPIHPRGKKAINPLLENPQQPNSSPPPADALVGEAQNLYAALLLLGLGSKANNVLECGHAFYSVECKDCWAHSRIYLSCHLRLCPKCARRLARSFITRHWSALQLMKEPKLLTLTFRSTKKLTRELITWCLKCFSKLRHRKLWTDNVRGGLAGLELTWGPPGWHPHLHVLLDSRYIPRPLLIDAWKHITGGAWHIDIRKIDSEAGVLEVAKYVAKGYTFYKQPHLLAQYLAATSKRRFLSAFGSLYRATDEVPSTLLIPDNPNSKGPVDHWIFGPPLIPRCHQCGSTHVQSLGKDCDIKIDRPSVQIPF